MELKRHKYKVSFVNCKMRYDYLIVGQGLAGSLLAYNLIRAGKRVMVIDSGQHNSASRVAAGLFNPITGPKMVKTWQADVLFPFLHRFYSELEQVVEASFFYEKDIYRPFNNAGEQNEWQGRTTDPSFVPYIRHVYKDSQFGDQVRDACGGLMLKQAGYIDTQTMLAALNTFIQHHSPIHLDEFDEEKLEIKPGFIQYGSYKADRIILCAGYRQSTLKKYFGWLPIHPLKGEILVVKTTRPFKTLYNRNCFIIPLSDNHGKVGSTYNRQDPTPIITKKGRKEISDKLMSLLKEGEKFTITDQVAGLRPVSRDRRPILGFHPKEERVGIFNGLGTKGVSLAPYFAFQMVNWLLDGIEPDINVNIKRFYSLYYKSFVVR
jgi:glycine/D-amino acid oxidase-like deaminating enzyme